MKRIKITAVCFFTLIMFVVCRVFHIGVVKQDDYTKSVMSQRVESVTFLSPRGIIYDRNMIKLTDSKMKLVVRDGVPYYVGNRTTDLCSHIIGYISADGKGSGIEGAFDYVLSSDKTSRISYIKDINNQKISSGYSIDVEKSYKGVCLTVDYHIQEIVENAMDFYGVKGAVVVADCKSGEVLAMASRPNYHAANLEKFLDGTDGELVNKAICAYNPGSVFKIAVASAFLENHYNDEMNFECNGKTVIDGVEFVCHKEEGHGVQTLEQAFANSCNCAFYNLGNTVGIDDIYDFSVGFGFGKEVFCINGIAESVGTVPSTAHSRAEVANVSIGQGDVMVTPLQIADMLCTICNGGVRNQLTLIRGVVDDKGNCVTTDGTQLGRVITETTARRMMDMMNAAVEYGTGMSAQLDGCLAGGKTGSAETGWLKDGKMMQQGWFAGYFPTQNPRYVCVVMVENGISGSDSACPIFKKIGNDMVLSGYVN
ncbi:MAG: penicillin-binding protein 2 [Clostridia bacterium]|nr:penicillin-binding protein 2 [Clostridia bacterium]